MFFFCAKALLLACIFRLDGARNTLLPKPWHWRGLCATYSLEAVSEWCECASVVRVGVLVFFFRRRYFFLSFFAHLLLANTCLCCSFLFLSFGGAEMRTKRRKLDWALAL